MKIRKMLSYSSLALLLCGGFISVSQAQSEALAFMPETELPAENFVSSQEHYEYLLEQANGGTQHTMATIPVWDGLWSSGANTMPAIFFEGGTFALIFNTGGTIKENVLTPAYEEHFRARRAEMAAYGEQRYDRLTNCEYPGVPRWLWEPYIKEFVNMPTQSWMLNDFMNESRRVYIDAEHINIDAKHSATGDSVGFWDGDKLVIWTKWINPADYVRGMPLTSNQFEMVESWQQQIFADGSKQLVTQVTFYDSVSLMAPQSAVYTHNSSPELEEIGVRIRNWECTTNAYRTEDGDTQFYLPGDLEFRDTRGFTDFPEIPGQSLNPIFNAE